MSETEALEVLWTPTDWRTNSRVGEFARWVETRTGTDLSDYDALWKWSVTDLDGFWSSIWDYFGVQSSTARGAAIADRSMPGAQWFPGARINYARHLLEDADLTRRLDSRVAVVGESQTRARTELTFQQLRTEVGRVRAGLRELGVGRGDRVVAYLPNIPETLIAYLATTSLGAIWASCAPEFGARSVIDRFGQIDPKVLFTVTGYTYGDKHVDRESEVAAITTGLPSVQSVVHVSYLGMAPPGSLDWNDLGAGLDCEPAYDDVPFDHPLCVLFSSGTTGQPKAIVHGHGGILLEHLKNHALSWDLGEEDRLQWFSTTAWMMWNAMASALLVRCSIVMIDGHPAWPDANYQWNLAASTSATVLGMSPGLVMESRKQGIRPARDFDLANLRELACAGSPLPAEGYRWIYAELGDVLLNVGSGGTDVCSGIVQGCPALPVWAGEISGRCLGVAADAFDDNGTPVVGELGELVITEPMPSMPVGFWNDADDTRLRGTYFDQFPEVWRHGDWIRFTADGSCAITGRSDATLNRGGVRLGTSDFYNVVEELPRVADSLVVHLEDAEGGNGELLLFVVAPDGLSDDLRHEIRSALRTALSPRHLPDAIIEVRAVPRNRTGKKLELPAKRILQGRSLDEVASRETLADPTSLDAFVALFAERAHSA
ncbi:acetoacetate--CoA ligase [Nocardioides sp. QY071]|uniref:acetoacetate--CoA ligase n=1 Tax=Nocardioides sp. QY071 TaxID=3044187 RepID=UPI00249AB6E2|nr:acetoacetate--CoA ligase [Nocardioides sp. QY071]WGY01700.1 acetoacetate--CoA ligase [Nocardioides sp. QY071]